MRIAVLFAASVLVAGCSPLSTERPSPTALTPISPSRTAGKSPTNSTRTSTATSTTSTASVAASANAPEPGAPAAEAIAWVAAAAPVDGKDFQVALRNGATTALGDDYAFTTPSGISCMTDTKRGSSALSCLVNLTAPPSPPPDVYGVWKGGWVDFDGATVQIGSAHGDPGRFGAGQGAPLPAGGSLSFGDFRCRTDAATLVCVNYARQTAVRYSDDGVQPYGCTRQTPPAGIGIQFSC
jgi:hypothetical protein